ETGNWKLETGDLMSEVALGTFFRVICSRADLGRSKYLIGTLTLNDTVELLGRVSSFEFRVSSHRSEDSFRTEEQLKGRWLQ
ncbi:MAG: hypothetical protein DRJ65_02435, partial [Acidobacteria bacterium]